MIAGCLEKKFIFQYRSEFSKKKTKSARSATTASIKYSLLQLLSMSQNELSQMVFQFNNKPTELLNDANDFTEIQEALVGCQQFRDVEKENIPSYKFFQIKKSTRETNDGTRRTTLQLIDISAKIFYDDIKAQKEIMGITTSTIGHQMRNPLNQILSQCQIQATHLANLKKFRAKVERRLAADERKELEIVEKQLVESCEIQRKSSQLLLFTVEDVLSMAQIRAQRFCKKIETFNLAKAIEEVVELQIEQA